jgi:hypothetical protein
MELARKLVDQPKPGLHERPSASLDWASRARSRAAQEKPKESYDTKRQHRVAARREEFIRDGCHSPKNPELTSLPGLENRTESGSIGVNRTQSEQYNISPQTTYDRRGKPIFERDPA